MSVRGPILAMGLLVVGLACSYALGLGFHLGLLGVLAGKAMEETTKLMVFAARYRSGRWHHRI